MITGLLVDLMEKSGRGQKKFPNQTFTLEQDERMFSDTWFCVWFMAILYSLMAK